MRKIAIVALSLPLIFGPAAAPRAHAEGASTVFAEYVGSEPYTDASGITYQADVFSDYVGDTTSSATTSPISGTTDDPLYQVARMGTTGTFSRAIPLPNGEYIVKLKFSEFTKDAVGQRVFDISMENQVVLQGLDIFASVGRNAAYDSEDISVTVTDGVLNIVFDASVGTPTISAIVVSSASDNGSGSVNKAALTAAIDAQYSDGSLRLTLALTEADYTPASWLTYNTAIEVGKTIEAASSTQEEVNAATAQITSVRAALVFASQEQLLSSISISPASASVALGTTTQLAATALDQDGVALEEQPFFTWSSSDTAVATVGTTTGLVTGIAVGGPVVITAAIGAVSGTSTLMVATVDETSLTDFINAQYSDGAARLILVLVEAQYTPASWAAYMNSLEEAIALEAEIQAQTDAAIAAVTQARAALVLARETDANAVAAAKAAIAAASYANLLVSDTTNQLMKTAAVQTVVDDVKGTTTAVVTFDQETGDYVVAISKGASSDTVSITSATFSQSCVVVDKAALTELINAQYVNGACRTTFVLTEALYTPASWATYTSALLSGKAVESSATSTQAQIDAAVTAITQARAALVLVEDQPDAATSAALESAVAGAAALQESHYTPASWAALTAALALPQAKKSEVIVKTASINCAIAQLVRLVAGMTFPLDITKSGNEASTTLSSALETATTTGPANLAITVTIPAGTVIRGSAAWDGVLTLPVATTTFVLVPTSGNTASVVQAIEIGAGDISLTFDKAAKIVFAGQAGKLVGWSQANVFHQITSACPSSATSTSPALSSGADCKIDAGPDLVVWTKHFSTFIAYTESAAAPASTNTTNNSTSISTSSGGGGGGGGRLRGGTVLVGEPISTTQSSVVAASAESPALEAVSGQTLVVPVYTFSKNLLVGSRGADVTALQQYLVESGYPIAAGVTGYFGGQTRAAVIAYQRANGLPATGYVGNLTLALLNKKDRTVAVADSALTGTQADSIVSLLRSFDADSSVIERVRSVLGRITRTDTDEAVPPQMPVETGGGVVV